MAQKTEKEETEFKVPETITLCINNCGVIGNPATNNMCQKCFTTSTTATTPAASSSTISSSSSASSSSSNFVAGIATPMQFSAERSPRSRRLRSPDRPKATSSSTRQNSTADRHKSEDSTQTQAKRSVNRCSGCRRKVGLTGFRCRCGELFCSEHRYSDRHDCSYDYKAAGREAIARENPVVKAAKIVRV